MDAVARAFYLALPVTLAAILHMVVVKRNLWPALSRPLDGGRTFGGQPIFGPNKTWRGAVWMVLASGALGAGLGLLFGPAAAMSGLACLDYAALAGAPGASSRLALAGGYGLVHAALGLGYVLGELPNSFLKRRLSIHPGRAGAGAVGALFRVVDQVDSVLFALGLGWLLFGIEGRLVWLGVLCLSALHFVLNGTLYAVKLRKNL